VILRINDWIFDIDLEKTREHSSFASSEHCTCGYCENYYRAVNLQYPGLKAFLLQFGLRIDGPVEMYPIEPTLYLAGYRVTGRIVQAGNAPMMVDGIPISAEPVDEHYFMVEAGEMPLPWVLHEDMDEVISPANEPEFLAKMYRKIALRRGYGAGILS